MSKDRALVEEAAKQHPIWLLANRIDAALRAIRQSTGLDNAIEIAASSAWLTAEIRGQVARLRERETPWQAIEALDDPDREVLMWTPRERIYTKEQLAAFPDLPIGEQRVSTRRHWTWATHWRPLPSAPPAPQEQK